MLAVRQASHHRRPLHTTKQRWHQPPNQPATRLPPMQQQQRRPHLTHSPANEHNISERANRMSITICSSKGQGYSSDRRKQKDRKHGCLTPARITIHATREGRVESFPEPFSTPALLGAFFRAEVGRGRWNDLPGGWVFAGWMLIQPGWIPPGHLNRALNAPVFPGWISVFFRIGKYSCFVSA